MSAIVKKMIMMGGMLQGHTDDNDTIYNVYNYMCYKWIIVANKDYNYEKTVLSFKIS